SRAISEAQICRRGALLAPQPASDCGFGRSKPRNADRHPPVGRRRRYQKSFFRLTGSTLSKGAVISLYECSAKIRGGNFGWSRSNPAASATMKTLYDLLEALPR